MKITVDQKKALYRYIYLGRRFEDILKDLFAANQLAGWVHLGQGQEATGAAISLAIGPDDYLAPYHRSRISMMGKGMPPVQLLSEIAGRVTGTNHGLGGEAHVVDPDHGVYATGGIIGSNLPIAVGIAYACKLEGKDRVTVVGCGEGGSARGAFHEALNFAGVAKLPIVFIVENNLYAEFTPVNMELSNVNVADRGPAYGIPSASVDGTDPEAVLKVVTEAVERARKGGGPTLIESKTYRYGGHFEGDACDYRTKDEAAEWKEKDPLPKYRAKLIDEGISEEELKEIEAAVDAELDKAVEDTFKAPKPSKEDLLSQSVYA